MKEKYQFSAPMPFKKNHIDKLLNINKEVEKSKITSLYFSLPTNSPDFTGFEQGRYIYKEITYFNYWKPLIEYSLQNGFDFIYLLNSPKVYNPEFDNVDEILEKLDRLINNLRNLGCNKVRICNPQLMGYINAKYPDIELYLSTSLEFQSIKQYANLFSIFKNIKEFVPSWDLNKNFMFLKNIKKRFPNINIELMVNEGCLQACPIRTAHNIFITGLTKESYNNPFFLSKFYLNICKKNIDENIHLYLSNTNIIYPWEIKEYAKIGIHKFKLVGRNSLSFFNGEYLKYYMYYLKGIDCINDILNIPIRYFNHYIQSCQNISLKIRDVLPYIPKIKHFINNGNLCASKCGNECMYCYKCAKNIEKIFKVHNEKERKRHLPFCKK